MYFAHISFVIGLRNGIVLYWPPHLFKYRVFYLKAKVLSNLSLARRKFEKSIVIIIENKLTLIVFMFFERRSIG